MTVVASVESEIRRLEPEWEQLADRAGATPFHYPGWARLWSASFGRGNTRVIALWRSGHLAAVLPLQAVPGRLASPTNWHTPFFSPTADGPESARDVLDALFGLGVRSIDLSMVEVDDSTFDRALEAARHSGHRVAARTLIRSPALSLEGSWEDYEQSLSRNRRKGTRRRLRRLQERGTVTLEIESGGPRLAVMLHQAFRVEASGWKGRGRTAIVSRPETARFYTAVANWAAERGWLRLALLRLDGVPIAFDLSLEKDSVRYSLKAGYHDAFARYGPGSLLLYRLIEDAYASGLERFELLGPEDDFKLGWSDRAHERAWLRACAPSITGRAEATIVHARERVRPLARRARAWGAAL